MRRTILWVGVTLFLGLAVVAASAQAQDSTPPPAPQPPSGSSPRVQSPRAPNQQVAPDMVCFGYYPNWSVQFINGEARYLGDNESNRTFLGDFYWVPEDNAWDWHRANGLAPADGGYALSASIERTACHDTVLKTTFPYSAEVNLPQGTIVSGCCRKLKPGEAPVGRHGVPPQQTAPPPQPPSQ
ncbi:MAG: hypothetical protein ACLPPV_16445 [Candidatus Korobacteraceae bacterium]